MTTWGLFRFAIRKFEASACDTGFVRFQKLNRAPEAGHITRKLVPQSSQEKKVLEHARVSLKDEDR